MQLSFNLEPQPEKSSSSSSPASNPRSEEATQAELQSSLRKHYLRLRGGEIPEASITFYPYSQVTHTIRIRDEKLVIRISDLLRDAPGPVLDSVVRILLHKLYERPVPRDVRKLYQDYINEPALREKARENRRRRGNKRHASPVGDVFNLGHLFEQLNQKYFEGALQIDELGWSMRKSRRTLGHYDPAHNSITINRRLDNPLVPEHVVSFVLYHEMLHAALGEVVHNGRRHVHHRNFKEAEKRFEKYTRARKFIRRYFG
ncbi:MAG: SprT-like domain-containing protein [Acidobacteriota bacterium]|nr:MAG: SprT-like domain-containing protein [Acidobacteriota bacterium]